MKQGIAAGFIHQQHIYPENGFNTCAHCGFIELHQTEKIGQIGNRDSWHPDFLRSFHQRLDADSAIGEGVFGVEAEVDELGHGDFAISDRKQ